MSNVKFNNYYSYPEQDELPDIAEKEKPLISYDIPKVGIKGFEMPVCWNTLSETFGTHLTTINVYASVRAEQKGLSMSMIPLTLYEYRDLVPKWKSEFGTYCLFFWIEQILKSLKEKFDAAQVYIKLAAKLPFNQESLKTHYNAIKYYPVAIQSKLNEIIAHYVTVTIDYSSACPCSLELSKHYQKKHLDTYPVPHSQRSIAEVTIQPEQYNSISINQYVRAIESAIKTPTQVLVRRLDEQAFAVLNGKYPKFVEDAARLIKKELNELDNVKDFVCIATHYESLHNFQVQSIIFKGVLGGLR